MAILSRWMVAASSIKALRVGKAWSLREYPVINRYGLNPASSTGATNVPGVYVAGDAGTFGQNVVMAAAAGAMAGGMVNEELAFEHFAELAGVNTK